MIIIDLIVYGRKRKTCIIFRRKINGNVAWWFLDSSIFSAKILLLFTPAIFYTHILLSFSIHILSLHIHWPIIHVIFSFGRIIIDIIVYGRKWKTCINILLSFSIHIFSFAYTLTYNSRHFFFWNDNNWPHCLWKEKKDVYYF